MKYNKINFFLPTYKRVSNGKLPRFVNSIRNNASSLKNIFITFLVNSTDYNTVFYLDNLTFPVSHQVLLYNDVNRPHLGKMYNYIYEYTKCKDAVISMVSDDMEFKTSGYDLAILHAVNKHNGLCVVWCNDGFQKDKLCVNLFTTRKLVELTGHPFMCELFPAYFIDTVWMKVLRKMNIGVYLKDVLLKHHHASFNKNHRDETFQRLQAVKPNFKKGYAQVEKYSTKIIKELKTKL